MNHPSLPDSKEPARRPELVQSGRFEGCLLWKPAPARIIRVLQEGPLEFLVFVLIFAAAWLVLRKPRKERLAFGLLVASALMMALVFSLATRTSLLPGLNY